MVRQAFEVHIDDAQQKAFARKLTPQAIQEILTLAGEAGGKAGVAVLRRAAAKGTQRPSQYYRRNHLSHGTFRESIRAARIHRPDWNQYGRVVGFVLGPIGLNAFTRAWREFGTQPHDQRFKGRKRDFGKGRGQHPGARATHWLEHATGVAFTAATSASQEVLKRYTSG